MRARERTGSRALSARSGYDPRRVCPARFDRHTTVSFLTADEIDALLAAPDASLLGKVAETAP